MAEKDHIQKEPGVKEQGPVQPRYEMMAVLRSESPLTAEEFAEIVAGHRRFIAGGGGGGRWETVLVGSGFETGIVMGVYVAPRQKEGAPGGTPAAGEEEEVASAPAAQADLSHKCLDGLELCGVELPCANLCGISCRQQDLSGANLADSLITDADLTGSVFRRANLARGDLSRSELAGCDFREADLTNADLENADLTGADLRGAKLDGARFPGTKLDGVRR